MIYPKEIIKKIYRTLPDEINQVIATDETGAAIDEVTKKYNLSSEQRLSLGDEVTLTLLGITPLILFSSNIQNRLKIEKDVATNIENEISRDIFSKIDSEVFKLQEERALTILNTKEPVINLTDHLEINPPEEEILLTAPKTETLIPVPSYTQTTTTTPEENLPAVIEPKKFGYGGGVDPYREPTN